MVAILLKKARSFDLAFFSKNDIYEYYIGFFVVSVAAGVAILVVSFLVVSVAAGAVIFAVSVDVESEPLAFFSEPQPAAIEPIIVATIAKLKMCFFIGF
jgi:hypothetical protein